MHSISFPSVGLQFQPKLHPPCVFCVMLECFHMFPNRKLQYLCRWRPVLLFRNLPQNTGISIMFVPLNIYIQGAPETIQDRLMDLPPSYVMTYKKYTRQGSRVLALAFKSLPDMTVSEARSLDRDVVESGLTFAGFSVFNCPIRADSASVLFELKGSSHDLVMITGDQALTACHVASQVHIISRPALILSPARSSEGYEWISPDESELIPYSEKEVDALSQTHDLCIGGDCIEMLQRTSAVLQVVPYVKVFARVAPQQKELIMTTLSNQ
ncbi:hypothetical protein SAY86_010700 [Trapa natans]|uniref:Uncharacterized protein n=1 Tax=Trapa natans TaxID=22666 RepID=A0AAN7LHL6_TRANT|nr:hypothetical protein SAY86_010700 [Trapa natans]